MQQDRNGANGGNNLLDEFTSWLRPILKEGLNVVIPAKEQENPRTRASMSKSPRKQYPPPMDAPSRPSNWNNGHSGHHARQTPPPPPPPAPETPSEESPDRMALLNGHQDLLEARKKEMQEELEADLKQLDSERKEGLYRLDWELAEAIEALHARHAQRANEKIRQHKEFVSEMEKRAQAGEDLTPETVQRLKSPVTKQVPRNFYMEDNDDPAEATEEESSSESSEEGVISTVINFFRDLGDESPSAPASARRAHSREYSRDYAYEYPHYADEPMSPVSRGASYVAPPPMPYTPEGAPFEAHHPMPNGYPPPHPMYEAPHGLPTMDFAGSFSGHHGRPSVPVVRTSSMPVWPPANVYHGGMHPH